MTAALSSATVIEPSIKLMVIAVSKILRTALLVSLLCVAHGHAEEEQEAATVTEEDRLLLDTLEGKGEAPQGELLEYYESARGYLATPSGDGPFGSIILIHEWNGLVTRVKQVADALASQGYIALAADLYSGRTGSTTQENMALVMETLAEPDELIANLNAAATYLRERDDSNGLVATVGWCYGGGVALTFAIGGEHHDGTAIFYGRLLYDPEELAKVSHEFHGTFVAQDPMIPVSTVDEFAAVLREAGIANDIHVYDPVAHGFWLYVDRDLEANKEPATHAWGRLKGFFERVLTSDGE